MYGLSILHSQTTILSLDEEIGELVDGELGELGRVGDKIEDPDKVGEETISKHTPAAKAVERSDTHFFW